MLSAYEQSLRLDADGELFTFVAANGSVQQWSRFEARLLSAALARHLAADGAAPGDGVVLDAANCPGYVLALLACGYGGYTLVCMNPRLTEAEKRVRLAELERSGMRMAARWNASALEGLIGRLRRVLSYPEEEESLIHFAERSAHLFDDKRRALVMFTSGSTGCPKAVPLTWFQLRSSAQSANALLGAHGSGRRTLWQAALPLYHIGGMQVVMRSLVSHSPFRLYEHFDAGQVLRDGYAAGATHLSVVDKMLQDLLREDGKGALSRYRCVLLGGGPVNDGTLTACTAASVAVFASYGMTETASFIACARVTSRFTGGLSVVPGIEVRIVDEDDFGYGRLAVRGACVFDGYLNGRTTRTVDGFFLTGDTARLEEGRLYIRERTADMFVSGGENVYPAQIAGALKQIPGVADAHVFSVPDEAWGRRPVALVERAPGVGRALTVSAVREQLGPLLSRIYQPKHLCLVNELPRMGVGKLDRQAIEALYADRLETVSVSIYHVRLPFKHPFTTARGVLNSRDSLILEVRDGQGRTGLGECTSFATDWYLPEVLGDDLRFLKEVLVPLAKREAFLHPREAAAAFAEADAAGIYPAARSALEMALWDLYGKVNQEPFWRQIGREYRRLMEALGVNADAMGPVSADFSGDAARVRAGAVVGLGPVSDVVEQVQKLADQDYRRIKLKIAPGRGFDAVRAIRTAFPLLLVTLDANRSFTRADFAELRAYDELNVGWIEEPLAPIAGAYGGRTAEELARLANAQRVVATPLCVDETVTDAADFGAALRYGDLRCFALKVGKLGGVEQTLSCAAAAQSRGREVWMGGMYDTGISRRVSAAFETLPGIIVPGDIGAVGHYFSDDIASPPYTSPHGLVTLNGPGCREGIGCSLNREVLDRVSVESYEL